MGRRVDVEQLVGASDIAHRLGWPRTQDVHTVRARDPEFPEPLCVLGGGERRGFHVWYWPDVAVYARKKGITPGPPREVGKRSTPSARAKRAEMVQMREELAELAQMREQLGELSQLRQRLEALEAERDEPDEDGDGATAQAAER